MHETMLQHGPSPHPAVCYTSRPPCFGHVPKLPGHHPRILPPPRSQTPTTPSPSSPIDQLRLGTDIPITITKSYPVGNTTLHVMAPDCDAIMQMYIDLGQCDRDPYWTCLWPSSIAMFQELVSQRPHLVAGRRVADLGCGLGVGGLAAAFAGASEVVFLDREPLALQCSLINAALNGFENAIAFSDNDKETKRVMAAYQHDINSVSNNNSNQTKISASLFDWHAPPPPNLLHSFDVVLACDVLYEAFSVDPVATVAPTLLSPRSSSTNKSPPPAILLADPPLRAKQNRERFLQLLSGRGDFLATEMTTTKALVWEEDSSTESSGQYRSVDIEFMVLQQGAAGDTIGVKFYNE